jgi:hypothetical protein
VRVTPEQAEQASKTYSADLLTAGSRQDDRIRGTWEHAGKLWVCVGIMGRGDEILEVRAVRLVDPGQWAGKAFGHAPGIGDGRKAYRGRLVRSGRTKFVMTGEEARFVPGTNSRRSHD